MGDRGAIANKENAIRRESSTKIAPPALRDVEQRAVELRNRTLQEKDVDKKIFKTLVQIQGEGTWKKETGGNDKSNLEKEIISAPGSDRSRRKNKGGKPGRGKKI